MKTSIHFTTDEGDSAELTFFGGKYDFEIERFLVTVRRLLSKSATEKEQEP